MGSTSVKDVACALISMVGIATSLSVATMIFRSLRPSLYRQGLSCDLSDYRNCLRLHGIAKSEFRKSELAGSGGAKAGGTDPSQYLGQDKQVCLLQTHNQGRHEANRGPLKGTESAQKALQGSETQTRELLGGTVENSVGFRRGH